MKHLIILLALLAFGSSLNAHQPNVLFIAIDDLRPELSLYGSHVPTPNLDASAHQAPLLASGKVQLPYTLGGSRGIAARYPTAGCQGCWWPLERGEVPHACG